MHYSFCQPSDFSIQFLINIITASKEKEISNIKLFIFLIMRQPLFFIMSHVQLTLVLLYSPQTSSVWYKRAFFVRILEFAGVASRVESDSLTKQQKTMQVYKQQKAEM